MISWFGCIAYFMDVTELIDSSSVFYEHVCMQHNAKLSTKHFNDQENGKYIIDLRNEVKTIG